MWENIIHLSEINVKTVYLDFVINTIGYPENIFSNKQNALIREHSYEVVWT